MRLPSLGVRGRLLAVLVAAMTLATLGLVPALRGIIVTQVARPKGERLLAAARVAAANTPADPARWDAWAASLSGTLHGVQAWIVRSEPGRADFAEQCLRHGVPASRALTAFLEGDHLLLATSEANGEGRGPERWVALARLAGPGREQALLVLADDPSEPSPGASVWTLTTLYGVMAVLLALAGGAIAGWLLLVRPTVAATAMARRAAGVDAPQAGDLDALPALVETLSRDAREARQSADRQAFELKRIRADLKGAQGTLLRAEKLASVGQLAAGIAHEIGNPVGVILGMSEVLKQGATPEESQRFAAEIHAATLRLHATLKDLLTFARPAREEGATADVREVVESTLKLLAPQKRFRDVAVELHVDEAPIIAEIKPSQLQQILLNLLLNAADAMKGRGRVTVRARREDRMVAIGVADEGPGIPEADRQRIFDPFFSTKAPGEGTGLGLPICAQIVEVYGGEIAVEGEPGEGATFTIRLWRADAGGQAPAPMV